MNVECIVLLERMRLELCARVPNHMQVNHHVLPSKHTISGLPGSTVGVGLVCRYQASCDIVLC